jgi:ureidoglycolate lyase
MRTLSLQSLTPEAFAAYGHAFDLDDGAGRSINAGTTRRLDLAAGLDLGAGGEPPALAVFHARAQAGHGPWRLLERHRLGSQTFVPLADVGWIVLVALGDDPPRPDSLAAFRATGRQGITLRRGTWHHPLVALADGAFLVLERAAAGEDCEVVHLPEAVQLR